MDEDIQTSPKENNFLLPASIIIAALMISGSVVYLVKSGNSGGNGKISAGDQTAQVAKETPKISERDVVLGDPNAPVSFIEYGDYQCPFCGRFFEQVEPPLRDAYIKTGKVKMVFRNFAFLGPESLAAAEATECAKDQNAFWVYHDALYTAEIRDGKENNGNLIRDLFLKLANDLHLDANTFAACLDSKKYADQVEADVAHAQSLGVNSTPTTFINSKIFEGALPYAQFKAAIDSFL